MNGIFYFSSTGNSLYVAKALQEKITGQLRYIPSYTGDGREYETILIVSPVYSYGLPVHVFELLPSLRGRDVYMILTYGGMLAGADRLAYEYACENGLNIKGVYAVKMAENFTLTFSTPEFYNKLMLRSVPGKVQKIAASIGHHEQNIPRAKKTKRQEHERNKANWHLIAKDFSVTEDCIQCRKCVNLCPAGNISVQDGKIRFADSCVACLGCYHRCPTKAIRYKNRKKSDRYFHPDVKETDLGNDILLEGVNT